MNGEPEGEGQGRGRSVQHRRLLSREQRSRQGGKTTSPRFFFVFFFFVFFLVFQPSGADAPNPLTSTPPGNKRVGTRF
jgi:hypothetical protein